MIKGKPVSDGDGLLFQSVVAEVLIGEKIIIENIKDYMIVFSFSKKSALVSRAPRKHLRVRLEPDFDH